MDRRIVIVDQGNQTSYQNHGEIWSRRTDGVGSRPIWWHKVGHHMPSRLPMLPTLLSTSVDAGLDINSKERTYFGAATLRNRLHVFGGQNLDYKVRSRFGLKGWHTVAAVLEHYGFWTALLSMPCFRTSLCCCSSTVKGTLRCGDL